MTIIENLMNCSVKDRALLILGVLLDGYDAIDVFSYDRDQVAYYTNMAKDLASIPIETRIPLLSTVLRELKEELADS